MECSIEGCDKLAFVRGWCHMHYNRWHRHGDPLHVKHNIVFGTIPERFWVKVGDGPLLRPDLGPCREWTAHRNWQGYGSFSMDRGGSRWRPVGAHVVAWELTYGDIPPGLLVCHCCDNPPCCEPTHLFLGSHKDNAEDRDSKGRDNDFRSHPEWRSRGESHGLAKLTEQTVRRIRDRYAAGGVSQQMLANEFGVHQTKISAVVNRRTWKHVP